MSVPADDSGPRAVALLCAAEVLSMTGFSTYPALLAPLRETWGMSGAEAAFGSLGLACACGPLAVWFTNRKDGK